MDDKFPLELQYHDTFNLIVLGGVVCLVLQYLIVATDWNLIGTANLGNNYESRGIYAIISKTFLIYLVVDIIWIYLVPKSIIVKPYEVIIHHIATIALVCLPIYSNQFEWHGAISMSVELQTLVQVLRRKFTKDSVGYKVMDIVFYALWFAYRLVLFPFLVVFFAYEYRRYSIEINSIYNPVAMASPLFLFLTIQGFIWTYKVLTKALNVSHKES
jgi:hypothetical protein